MGNGYAMTDRNIDLSFTIIKLHEQQQYMRDYRIHSVVYLRLHIPKVRFSRFKTSIGCEKF